MSIKYNKKKLNYKPRNTGPIYNEFSIYTVDKY